MSPFWNGIVIGASLVASHVVVFFLGIYFTVKMDKE